MLPAQNARLQRLLRGYGMDANTVDSLVADVSKIGERHTKARKDKDIASLLFPLQAAIRAMQSSKSRWSSDPYRARLYQKYLAVLLAVRQKIQSTWALNVQGYTITELARANGVPVGGLDWQDWVPTHIKNAAIVAFDTLYNETLPKKAALAGNVQGDRGAPVLGKRLIPFRNTQATRKSDKRWDSLLASALSEREGFKHSEEHGPYLEALDAIIERIHMRDRDDVAPVDKFHLLARHQKDALEAWEAQMRASLNRTLADPASREMAALHDRTEQTKKLKAADAARIKRNAYNCDYMARKRKVKQNGGEQVPQGEQDV
jgi:hypothetical protein